MFWKVLRKFFWRLPSALARHDLYSRNLYSCKRWWYGWKFWHIPRKTNIPAGVLFLEMWQTFIEKGLNDGYFPRRCFKKVSSSIFISTSYAAIVNINKLILIKSLGTFPFIDLCKTVWSSWSKWGKCEKKSDSVFEQNRTRTCSRQDKCAGISHETRKCAPEGIIWGNWSKCNCVQKVKHRLPLFITGCSDCPVMTIAYYAICENHECESKTGTKPNFHPGVVLKIISRTVTFKKRPGVICFGESPMNITYPVNIYLFKVNYWKTRKTCEICSKLTIKTPERRQWRHSVFFLFLTLNIFHTFF